MTVKRWRCLMLALALLPVWAEAQTPFPMPGMTGDQLTKLAAKRQDDVLAKMVHDGSVVSRGKCKTGKSRFLRREPNGASFWKVDCIDTLPHLVVMPTQADKAASVLACPLAKSMMGFDCETGQMRQRR